jgi:excinuclease UvrABC nuclease subunit
MRTRICDTEFPGDVGVYVVYETDGATRPLYVGVASRRSLRQRWGDHLGSRSGSSALRRSLAVHLNLMHEKLRRPDRYHAPEVEKQITAALSRGYVELYPCTTEAEALALEARLIRELDPILNVLR